MTQPPGPLVCPVCGTPPVPGAKFCHNCGAALEVAGVTDATAERRIVTVLFGDLSDFTAWAEDLDPERVGVVTDRVLAALSRITLEIGGRVDKLTGDGIMAVFGAPTAHEDDAERAVRAAAEMQREVRQLMEEEAGGGRRMGLRVGLNTGEVLAGVQAHLAYTVVGDTVNTASRLSDAAGIGAIFAGRDTALATMSLASWRALPPLRLKGKREPVPAYELVGLRPPGAVRVGLGDEAPFIGRDAEFGRLVGKLLDVVESGRPASIVVTGEAGVGKTRLLVELDRFSTELPVVRLLWGRCTPFGEGRELAPLAEWVRTVFGITDADDVPTAESKARRTIARLSRSHPERAISAATVDRLLTLLGLVEWAPLGPRDNATPGGGGSARDPFIEAVTSVLAAVVVDGPLVLVVDDAQWAAPDVLRTMADLALTLPGPVLLVAAGRSEVLGQDWWERLPSLEVLPLAPLDESAAERLLRAYLGGAELDASTRDVLLARAQGNPFFLAELLHLLVDRGLLRRVGEDWRLSGELPRDILPAGVQAVLAARFDTLDAAAKTVLRDAAIVGTRFTTEMVAALATSLDETAVQSAVDQLIARGIVRPADGDTTSSYTFAHTLAQDVTYAGIAKAERARRHAQLARWAVEQLRLSAAEVDAVVATQVEQAVRLATEMRLPDDDPAWTAREAGVGALVRLGQAALARDDNRRADSVFTRAVQLAGDVTTGATVLDARVGRAAARVALHRLPDAEADLELPQRSNDQRRRASALVVLGDIRRRRGDLNGATQALVSALAAASEAGVDRVTSEALRQLGMIDYRSGKLTAAEGRFREALALAQRVGDRRGAGWALQHLAWSATTRGDYALAELMLGEAAEVFASLDDEGGLSWCAGTEAFVRLLQGRLNAARDLARGLLTIGQAMGDEWGTAACLTIDAYAAAELGWVSTSLAEISDAEEIFRAVGDTWGQSLALVARGAALRADMQYEEAIAALQEAVRISVESAQPASGALALATLGYCWLDVGDLEGAERTAREAIAVVTGLELRAPAFIGPHVLLAQVFRARGRLEEALPLLKEAAAVEDEGTLVFPRRQALAHLAGALLASGDVATAVRTSQQALSVAAEDVRSRVVALRVLAQCLTRAGDVPAGLMAARQAVALAEATEMRGERDASHRLLNELSGSGDKVAARKS